MAAGMMCFDGDMILMQKIVCSFCLQVSFDPFPGVNNFMPHTKSRDSVLDKKVCTVNFYFQSRRTGPEKASQQQREETQGANRTQHPQTVATHSL